MEKTVRQKVAYIKSLLREIPLLSNIKTKVTTYKYEFMGKTNIEKFLEFPGASDEQLRVILLITKNKCGKTFFQNLDTIISSVEEFFIYIAPRIVVNDFKSVYNKITNWRNG